MSRIATTGLPWVMWDEPPPRWIVFAVGALALLADITQLGSLIPGL